MIRAGLVALTGCSFVFFPSHKLVHSAAESEIVKLLRAVDIDRIRARGETPPRMLDRPVLPFELSLASNRWVTILSRRHTGFVRGQGDPVYAALATRRGTSVEPLGQAVPPQINPKRHYLLLLDAPSVQSTSDLGLFARLYPEHGRDVLAAQAIMRRVQDQAEELLESLDPAAWHVVSWTNGPSLRVYLLTPTP